MRTESRLKGMIGFAMRAGALVIGTELVCQSMAKAARSKPRLVAISENASDATKKKLHTKAEFYGIKTVLIKLTPDELGALLGKSSTPVCIGITDDNFAELIAKASEENSN